MWGEPPGPDDFVLPGDDKIQQQLEQQAQGQEAPAEPEPAADTAPEGRPRDEHGRFVKSEQETPEAEAAPDEETAVEKTAEEKLAEKYDSDETIQKSYLELQRLYGDQTRELGQYRQYVEQMLANQQRAAQQPQDWQGLIDDNPAHAAQLAYQHGNQHAYRAAVEAWEDMAPGAPGLWAQNVQMQQQLEQLAQHQAQQAWQESVRQFSIDNPGFNEIPDEELLAAVQRNPVFGEIIRDADRSHDARMGALKVLYLDAEQARGRNSDTLVTAAQDIARAQAQATQEAKNEAILASATANLEGGPKKTGPELVGEQWDQMDTHSKGWNI